MPKVSVILSSYNHAPYVAEAIESVLNQTFRDFELLIFDDGSTDGSADIIRSFRDERIKAFLYEENRGPAEAAKEAFYAAQGEYVAVHHSDDVWELDKLEKQAAFLDEHEEYAACFSYASFIDEKGHAPKLEEGHFYKNIFQKKNRKGSDWLNYFFDHPNCLCHPSLLIRRDSYEKYKMFPPECLRQFPDFYMWLQLLASGGEIYIYPEELVRFRLRNTALGENTSAETAENLLRCGYEYIYLARIYASISGDRFCQAFPQFAEYVAGEDIRLALGKLCLGSWIPAYRFLGLELLSSFLNDGKAKEHYTCRNFWFDEGKTDCFGLMKDKHIAQMTLFYRTGDEYQEPLSIRKECYIHENDTFLVSFAVEVPDGTRALRFDPEEGHMVRVRLTSFQVNGVRMVSHDNGIREENGESFFYHGDPSYEVQGDFSGHLDVVISGEMSYPDGLAFAIKTQREKDAIQREKEAIQRQLEETKAQLELKKTELQTMRQSLSWRCTEPLRRAGRIARRWKQ